MLHHDNWTRNFKLYSFLQTPSPWGRGWDILAFEFQLYFISICLLMKQCSRVGIPVEHAFTYKVMTFDFYDSFQFLKRNQALFGLSYARRRLSYILILTRYGSVKMRVQNCHNTARRLWPKWNSSWKHNQYYQNTGFVVQLKPVTNSISFKRLWNWLLTSNQFLSAIMKQIFSASFGILFYASWKLHSLVDCDYQ